jgi:hypothetical protein
MNLRFRLFHCIIRDEAVLVLLVIRFIVDNIVEAKLVDSLRGGHHPQPVTELLLLEELLGAIQRIISACRNNVKQLIQHTGT